MSKFTLVLDSSQLTTFCSCPLDWYYTNVKKLSLDLPRRADDARDVGTYGHRILDLYYKLRASGVNVTEASHEALAYNPDEDTCVCNCPAENHKYLPAIGYIECQKCHHCLKRGDLIDYLPFPLNKESRFSVRERTMLYIAYWKNNDYQPLSSKHVEVGFSEAIYEDAENLFVLEGRIDLIATLQGLHCIVDHKFQLRMKELYSKSIQFKNYALVNKSLMLIINYIRLAAGVKKDVTFERKIVNFTVPELLAWKQKLIGLYFMVKRCMVEDEFPQNWGSCAGLYHPCIYTPLCEEFNKEMKTVKERQLYTIRKEQWRPW